MDYQLSLFNFGNFKLDGGSMFGSVPKNLWEKKIAADAQNRIPLATRSVILRADSRIVLIDCGMGEKWSDKLRAIYAIDNAPRSSWPFAAEAVTDVILTHLHFDHAGGSTTRLDDGSLVPTFPNARYYVQAENLKNASAPTLKERASYLAENFTPLGPQLITIDGDVEILPGIHAHRVDGHTRGQQWIEISSGESAYFFPTDLMPTSAHVPLAFHMGYDVHAEKVLSEKAAFLEYALQRDATIIFQHDPTVAAGKVTRDEKGNFLFAGAVPL
jgi:glyoxylase-like metal-dependent hydrolase (beta-lactamase superfamily II)